MLWKISPGPTNAPRVSKHHAAVVTGSASLKGHLRQHTSLAITISVKQNKISVYLLRNTFLKNINNKQFKTMF